MFVELLCSSRFQGSSKSQGAPSNCYKTSPEPFGSTRTCRKLHRPRHLSRRDPPDSTDEIGTQPYKRPLKRKKYCRAAIHTIFQPFNDFNVLLVKTPWIVNQFFWNFRFFQIYLAILAPPPVQRRVATSCSRWAAAELRNPRASRWPHHRNQRHKSNLARLRSLHGEVVDHIIISQGGGNSHPWALSTSGWFFRRFLQSTTCFFGGIFHGSRLPKKSTTRSTHILQTVELILSLLHYPNPPCIYITWRSVLDHLSPIKMLHQNPQKPQVLREPSEVRIYPAGKSSQEAWQLGSSAIRGLAPLGLNGYTLPA